MSSRRFLAIAPFGTTRALYFFEGSAWIYFPTQPVLDPVAGTLIIGLSRGKIIVWRGGAAPNRFGHYDPKADSWTYKDSELSQNLGPTCSGRALSDELVYATGSGFVQRYRESTGLWTSLTPTGPLAGFLYRILPVAEDVLWVCGDSAHLWYYTAGGGWVNRFSELPLIDGWPITNVRDAWLAPSGNLYVLVHVGATARMHLLRYDGAWTDLGNIGASTCISLWGTDDNHIWIVCDNFNMAVRFWNGSVFSTQSTNAAGTHAYFYGNRIVGLSNNELVAVSFPVGAPELIQTSAPPAWATVALPDALPPYAVGIQEATGPTITPIDPTDGETGVALDAPIIIEITDPAGLQMIGEGSPTIQLDGESIWSADVPLPPWEGTLTPITNGYRFEALHPTFLFVPNATYTVRVRAYNLERNGSELIYTFTTQGLTLTGRIGLNGGYEITASASGMMFPTGVDLPVRLGPAGDATDPLCYGGPGRGWAGRSDDGSTLTVYSPPVAAEGSYNVTVEIGGLLAQAGPIEVVEVPVKTAADAGRRTLAPWMAVGPRR